jgi:hypothetical protein
MLTLQNEGCSLHLHGYSDYDAYWDFFYSGKRNLDTG